MKYTIYISFFFIFQSILNINLNEERNKMLNALKEIFKDVANTFPIGKYSNYLKKPQTRAQTYVDFIDILNYDSIKQKYGFPDELMNQLKRMLYSSVYASEQINYIQRADLSYLERIFGVAKKLDEKVIFAILKTQTRSDLVIKYNIVRKRECTTVLFWKECEWVNEKVSRGFTESETNMINEGIKLHSEISMKNELNKLGSSYQTVLTQGSYLYSPSGYTVLSIIRNGEININGIQEKFVWHSGVTRSYRGFINNINNQINGEPHSLIITDNGNVVLNDKDGKKKWESNSGNRGNPPYYSFLSDEGIFFVLTEKGFPVWNSGGKFNDVDQIMIQDYKYYSKNGKFFAFLENNGSLYTSLEPYVFESYFSHIYDYSPKHKIKYPPFYVIKKKNTSIIQVIDSKNQVFYEAGPFYCGDCTLICSDRGYLDLIDSKGKIYWSSYS